MDALQAIADAAELAYWFTGLKGNQIAVKSRGMVARRAMLDKVLVGLSRGRPCKVARRPPVARMIDKGLLPPSIERARGE
jgi:hypothetical protein